MELLSATQLTLASALLSRNDFSRLVGRGTTDQEIACSLFHPLDPLCTPSELRARCDLRTCRAIGEGGLVIERPATALLAAAGGE